MRLPQSGFHVRTLMFLAAIVTLGLIGWRVYQDELETRWLILKLRHGNLAARRSAAIRARAAMSEAVTQDVFGAMLPGSPKPQARGPGLRSQRLAEALLLALADTAEDPDPSCRVEALRALGFMGVIDTPKFEERPIPRQILAASHAPEESVRAVAIGVLTGLARWDTPTVIGSLREALEDPSVAVRQEAAWQVGFLGVMVPSSQADAVAMLAPVVAGSDDPRVRARAIEAMSLFGNDSSRHPPESGPDVVPVLVAALSDPKIEVRRAAAVVLGHPKIPSRGGRISAWETRKAAIIPALEKSLTDEDRTVREYSALACFTMGRREPALKERLEQALSNPDQPHKAKTWFEEALKQWQAEQELPPPDQPTAPEDEEP